MFFAVAPNSKLPPVILKITFTEFEFLQNKLLLQLSALASIKSVKQLQCVVIGVHAFKHWTFLQFICICASTGNLILRGFLPMHTFLCVCWFDP